MSVFSSRPMLRWLVPLATAVVVLGGGAALGTLAAVAEPSLPERSAAQLLVDLQTARLEGLSGTVVQRSELGLPELPAIAAEVGGGLTSLVAGSNTLRVWYSGPDKARIALLSTLGETDFVRDGRDLWTWESRGNSAQHYRLPVESESKALTPADLPHSPQEAAELALAAVEPNTEVTIGRNGNVAGREAYELVLAPRDKASLVGQVRLAIDATQHIPLRVEIFPTGADEPAFEVAFTQISFDRPPAERFRFNPPPGVDVKEMSGEELFGGHPGAAAHQAKPDAKPNAKPDAKGDPRTATATVGEGWTTVFVAKVSDDEPAGKAGTGPDHDAPDLLGQFPEVRGAWGSGRLLRSKLISVLLTDDGRLLAGAVAPEKLYEVAGSAAAKVK